MTQPRVKAKNWVFTINNYTQDIENRLKELDCVWMIFGHEVGENGTPHLQGAVSFSTYKYAKSLGKLFPWHIDVMRGSHQENKTYCTKEDTTNYFEKGIMPLPRGHNGGEATKRKWEEAYNAALEGRFDDIPEQMRIQYYKTFIAIYNDNKKDKSMEDLGDKELKDSFLWIYGDTGTGKSHTARRISKELGCEEPYIKSLNKWWNGYSNQLVTIIEEADPDRCEHLASFFKQWCDKWNFTAEAKGSVFPSIRPRYIIVTSNYTIDECFPKAQDSEPLHRRFTEVHLLNKDYVVQWPTFPDPACSTLRVEHENVASSGNSYTHCRRSQGVPGSNQDQSQDQTQKLTQSESGLIGPPPTLSFTPSDL